MEEVRNILEQFNNQDYKDFLKNYLAFKERPVYEDVEDALSKARKANDARAVFKFTQLKKELQPNSRNYQPLYKTKYIVKQPEKTVIVSPKSHNSTDSVKQNAIEYILRNLPFKVYEQCVSRERSKHYYINKENLLKHISNTPELKHFFKNIDYKKKNKEEICKVIFSKN